MYDCIPSIVSSLISVNDQLYECNLIVLTSFITLGICISIKFLKIRAKYISVNINFSKVKYSFAHELLLLLIHIIFILILGYYLVILKLDKAIVFSTSSYYYLMAMGSVPRPINALLEAGTGPNVLPSLSPSIEMFI